MDDHCKTLLLDVSSRPISVIPWTKAFILLTLNKVEVLTTYDKQQAHTPTKTLAVPAVIRFIKARHKYHLQPRVTKRNLYARDKGLCQYCYKRLSFEASTIDHVIPKSRKGQKTWTNVVISCRSCNSYKNNMTLKEAGMSLKVSPETPTNLLRPWTINSCPEWNFWVIY